MADKIRYGVTLYSYSNEYVNGILSFEEILRTVKAQGYTGIELVASQMVPGWPISRPCWRRLAWSQCAGVLTSTWVSALTGI